MISPLEQVTNAALKFIEKRINQAAELVASAISKNKTDISIDTRPLERAAAKIERAVEKIGSPTFSGTVKVDQTEIKRELRALSDQLKKLSFPDFDNSEIVGAIKALKLESKEVDHGPLLEAIKKLKLEVPGTFKLDPNQVAQLSVGGAAVAPLTMATRISNTTKTVASAATEASYTFPSGTVGWVIKLRDQGTLGYYSWTIGTLPTSGTGTTYMTIPQNFLRSQQDVEYTGKTIYLGAEAAATYELEVFQR